MSDLEEVYARRFPDREARAKQLTWAEIGKYLQRFVDRGAPSLDIGCDQGYFSRHVESAEKWACDMRDVSALLPPDVHFVQTSGLELRDRVPAAHFGTVFMSNYLEHLGSSADVVEQLRIAAGLLRPGGRVVILQPNIRLTGAAYWDFIDHKVPLTEKSLREAAETAGFETERVIVRFLPYTTKSVLPENPRLVRLYLRIPLAWRFLGGQTLYVGRRP